MLIGECRYRPDSVDPEIQATISFVLNIFEVKGHFLKGFFMVSAVSWCSYTEQANQ